MIPPMFKQNSYSLKRSLSPIGTRGAPYPPNATSLLLKSQIVGIPQTLAIVPP